MAFSLPHERRPASLFPTSSYRLTFAGAMALALGLGLAPFWPVPPSQASGAVGPGPVFLPLIATPVCRGELVIQNLGADERIGVVVAFGPGTAECAPPVSVSCTGLLFPGSSWAVAASDLGEDVVSAVVFGSRPATRSELGLGGGGGAETMCGELSSLVGSCDDYRSLMAALADGEGWRGWPADALAGGLLGVDVSMPCPGLMSPGVLTYGSYLSTARSAGPSIALVVPDGGQVWVQNGGANPASVVVTTADGACDETLCPNLELAPGAAVAIDPTTCTGIGDRAVRISSDEPVAAVSFHRGDLLSLERAEAVAELAPGITPSLWVGPLVMDPERGATTVVRVVNLDAAREADVEVTFRDGTGRATASESLIVCPGGIGVATLPQTATQRGLRVGSVAVVSNGAVRLAATVTIDHDSRGQDEGARLSYALMPDPAEMPLASAQPAAVGLPRILKDLNQYGGTTEIALHNASAAPGWTQVSIQIYDQNALVDVLCHRLGSLETRYLNLDDLGALPPAARGAALIVPAAWDHYLDGEQYAGVVAVAVVRMGTRLGEEAPGDEVTASSGVVVADVPAPILSAATGNCVTGGSYEHVEREPEFTAVSAAGIAYAPALADSLYGPLCTATVEATNRGVEPGQVIVVLAGEEQAECACSFVTTLCSGLLAPGESWTFTTAEIPAGTRSAAVYGLDDSTVATAVCAALQAPSCEVLRAFHRAYGKGDMFEGLDLGAALHADMDVEVTRRCPDAQTPGTFVSAPYTAPRHELQSKGTSWQSVPFVLADKEGNSALHIKNTGLECTDVELIVNALGNCLRRYTCHLGTLAPGNSVAVGMNACVGPSFQGSVVVRAREPLAVVADWTRPQDGPSPPPEPLVTHNSFPRRLPADVDGNGVVDDRDADFVATRDGVTRGEPEYDARADLRPDGVIDGRDLAIVQSAQCYLRDAPPPRVTERAADTHVLLPLLGMGDADVECDLGLTVQNLGIKETGVMVVVWGEVGPGECLMPVVVRCSGPIAPGGSWHLPDDQLRGDDVPGGTLDVRSAIVFSLSTEAVPTNPALTHLELWCAWLRDQVDECVYAQFKADWDGSNLESAKGEPISVTVTRSCVAEAGAPLADAYAGIGAHRLAPGAAPYHYQLPLFMGANADFDTDVVLQNDGAEPALVEVTHRAQDDCSVVAACPPIGIAPGAAVRLDCRPGPDHMGSARITSNQPLAVMGVLRAERRSRRPLSVVYPAVAASSGDARGRGLSMEDRLTAHGPLAWSTDDGADAHVQITNLEDTRTAQVQVVFRDAAGAPVHVVEDFICPDGSATYFAPVIATFGGAPGSVEVRSVGHRGSGMDRAARIDGLVLALRYTDAARSAIREAIAYPLTPGPLSGPVLDSEPPQVLPAPGEDPFSGSPDGVGVVAVAGIAHSTGASISSHLVLSNRVVGGGHTDVAVGLYDQTGLVGQRCWRLGARETAYIPSRDLNLPEDFVGSAVISAVAWTHRSFYGGRERRPVALGAALVRHLTLDQNTDVPGDESAAVQGTSLLGPAGPMAAGLSCGAAPPPRYVIFLPAVSQCRGC